MKISHRDLLRKTGKGLKVGLLYLLLLALMMTVGLWLADIGMRHPESVASLKRWMHATRYGWLAWRLVLYCAFGWGCGKSGMRRAFGRNIVGHCCVSPVPAHYSYWSANTPFFSVWEVDSL